LNGGGYNNQAVKIITENGSVYSVEVNQTTVTCLNAAYQMAWVSFKENKTGTFQITEEEDNSVKISVDFGVYINLISGTINVTSYGNVGGDVIGTFSGEGENTSNGQAVQVTKGTFKVKRSI
jgi:hypothetical protein